VLGVVVKHQNGAAQAADFFRPEGGFLACWLGRFQVAPTVRFQRWGGDQPKVLPFSKTTSATVSDAALSFPRHRR
jgi:hypothetical protein